MALAPLPFSTPVSSVETVIASDSVLLPIGSLNQVLGYDESGNLSTVTVTFQGSTYVQTMSYTSGVLTGVSAWVKQ